MVGGGGTVHPANKPIVHCLSQYFDSYKPFQACAREFACVSSSDGSLLLLRAKLRNFLECYYPVGGDDTTADSVVGGVALRLRERFQKNDFTETKILPKDLFLVCEPIACRSHVILCCHLPYHLSSFHCCLTESQVTLTKFAIDTSE